MTVETKLCPDCHTTIAVAFGYCWPCWRNNNHKTTPDESEPMPYPCSVDATRQATVNDPTYTRTYCNNCSACIELGFIVVSEEEVQHTVGNLRELLSSLVQTKEDA